MKVKVNGLLLNNISDLVKLLYNQVNTIVECPIIETPSCTHFPQSKYCPDCGILNSVIRTGGDKKVTTYTLKDGVSEKNGFLKIIDENTRKSYIIHGVVEEHIEQKLKQNNWCIYIGNYMYNLVGSFDEGPSCLWLDSEQELARVCGRCYQPKGVSYDSWNYDIIHTYLDKPFIISTMQYGYFCKHVLELLQKNTNQFVGLNSDLFNANNLLETFSGYFVESYKIKPYEHNGCFY
jgi:hypothetical protein